MATRQNLEPDQARFLDAVERLAASEYKLGLLFRERSDALRDIGLYFSRKDENSESEVTEGD